MVSWTMRKEHVRRPCGRKKKHTKNFGLEKLEKLDHVRFTGYGRL